MRIGTNVAAIVANNALQKSQNNLSTSIERLSSGYKINGSKDDAAGCAISEKMRAQIRGLSQAQNNTADGVSVLNTAEGAITEIQSMLTRLKELSVQAANDVNSDDEREAIQKEIEQINNEIDRISDQTEFNTQSLINGNLSRRVYSDLQGVNQLSVSDSYTAGVYGITVTEDARQAIAVGAGSITMSSTASITKEQEGTISINGYKISISEGDTLDKVMGKIIDGVNITGGSAFTVKDLNNDTASNGTDYAGYVPTADYAGSTLVIMTNQYGSDQKMNITCDNAELADILGIPQAATQDGIYVEGSDVKAEIATGDDGKRIGFADSAILSTKGTVITVTDVNNKEFSMDVPGNAAGTVFDDSNNDGQSGAGTARTISQEVTDVGTMSIHVGANQDQVIVIDIPAITTYSLGTEHMNVMTQYTASRAISTVDEAINKTNKIRSRIGAYENRFDHTTNNLEVSSENLTKSLSTMIDTDMSEEMTTYTSETVLTQAATSILAQANERPSQVLQLLQ